MINQESAITFHVWSLFINYHWASLVSIKPVTDRGGGGGFQPCLQLVSSYRRALENQWEKCGRSFGETKPLREEYRLGFHCQSFRPNISKEVVARMKSRKQAHCEVCKLGSAKNTTQTGRNTLRKQQQPSRITTGHNRNSHGLSWCTGNFVKYRDGRGGSTRSNQTMGRWTFQRSIYSYHNSKIHFFPFFSRIYLDDSYCG